MMKLLCIYIDRTNPTGSKNMSFITERQKIVSKNSSWEVKEEQECRNRKVATLSIVNLNIDLNVFAYVNPRYNRKSMINPYDISIVKK